jgi:hypothetical protein
MPLGWLFIALELHDFDKREFAFAAPSVWNRLLAFVRRSNSVDSFNKHLDGIWASLDRMTAESCA